MERFSPETRIENLASLKSKNFDLLVIGGGITGAGVARDAASRGMSVALIEAQDFASGTSSRSSKLIHGGIRYLENLEFGLVYEALSERSILFQMAPHLVHPLRFVLPIYQESHVGMFKMGLGMWLYDALSLFEAPELHERLNFNDTMKRVPLLENHHLKGSYVYSDAYMDDDRLVIETLRSANDLGATSVNFVKAMGSEFENGKVKKVKAKDLLTNEEFNISASHIVSSVGPWTDAVAHTLFDQWHDRLRPSKGIHLTFSRDRFPLKEAVVMVSDDQKRIVFGIPRHEMVIVGTTDTDFSGDPGEVHSTREDVDYLLHVVDKHFPGAKIEEKDIIASYSGVRPLVDDGSSSESKTSREHVIIDDERGVTFVSGGKYTTYRNMAEETVGVALNHFSVEERVQFSHSKTKCPLNPLADTDSLEKSRMQINYWSEKFKIPIKDVEQLVERHGLETKELLENYSSEISPEFNMIWQFEAHHAIDNTMCLNLVDFYLRRSPLFLAKEDHGFSMLDGLSNLFARRLKWSDAERNKQIDAVQAHLNHEMSWVK